jgi:diaminohydroxyphosphoribosylaminopyrimidine deaminase/5-amino-6-(5-phosphoribosylamino)uracil reductase
VTLKQAATLDGAVADATGVRGWVTGPAARERVHRMRDVSDAIVVGVGTVLADDPLLTTRLPEGGRDPLRVVLDTSLRMPSSAAMLRSGGASGTLVLTAAEPESPAGRSLRDAGAEVVAVGAAEGTLDLAAAMREVARRGCLSVLAEAGPRLAGALLRAGLVSRVAWFFAPRILGDASAPRLVDRLGVPSLDEALRLAEVTVERVGEDILIEGILPESAEGRRRV